MSADALAPTPRPRRRSTNAQAAATASTRHRLDVFAVSVLDVIRCAGGWLADRALAGWDVNVFLPEGDDGNPLRILGVSLHSLADIDSAGPAPYAPTAVAVSAAAICADPQIERRLQRQFTREIAEVTVWGQKFPDDIGAYLQSVQHVPSAAAAAFKAHALRASGSAERVPTAEVLYTGTGHDDRPRLVAVGAALPAAPVWAPASARTR